MLRHAQLDLTRHFRGGTTGTNVTLIVIVIVVEIEMVMVMVMVIVIVASIGRTKAWVSRR